MLSTENPNSTNLDEIKKKMPRCERTLTKSEYTLDSKRLFCKIEDVDPITNCCTRPLPRLNIDCKDYS